MERLTRSVVIAVASSVLSTLASPAGAQPKPPANSREMLLNHWNDIGDKVVKMAEEFPEQKYDFKPVDDVRTFADVLRHVAFWNNYLARSVRGEKVDTAPNELSKTEYATKAKIVAALKQSVADAAAELKKQPDTPPLKVADGFTAFIGHNGEHYGQLVVYYRLNGLVPPASRGQ
jgi:uncharacterized damage-inducible protein DinB